MIFAGLSANVSVQLEQPTNIDELTSVGATPQSVQLHCHANGSDDINFRYITAVCYHIYIWAYLRWFLNGRKIKRDSAGIKYQIKGDQLTILSVSSNDNGVYACEVENTFGIQRSRTHFVLNVRRKIETLIILHKNYIQQPRTRQGSFKCQRMQ